MAGSTDEPLDRVFPFLEGGPPAAGGGAMEMVTDPEVELSAEERAEIERLRAQAARTRAAQDPGAAGTPASEAWRELADMVGAMDDDSTVTYSDPEAQQVEEDDWEPDESWEEEERYVRERIAVIGARAAPAARARRSSRERRGCRRAYRPLHARADAGPSGTGSRRGRRRSR